MNVKMTIIQFLTVWHRWQSSILVNLRILIRFRFVIGGPIHSNSNDSIKNSFKKIKKFKGIYEFSTFRSPWFGRKRRRRLSDAGKWATPATAFRSGIRRTGRATGNGRRAPPSSAPTGIGGCCAAGRTAAHSIRSAGTAVRPSRSTRQEIWQRRLYGFQISIFEIE